MTQAVADRIEANSPAENYERFFVPAIGAPMAEDLVGAAGLQPGERVLDVACGTGVVARLAQERVGEAGTVAGLDVNPAMLAVARSRTPAGVSIEWHEASAESMPVPDGSFDVVLCQMGLQFLPDKPAALREMRRVLAAGGRVLISVPGPRPRMFAIMSEALAQHLGPDAASFVDLVFSMHDADEMAGLLRGAGFRTISAEAKPRTLRFPGPSDFLWQYIYSTPLAQAAARADEATREAVERDVCSQWQEFVTDGSMTLRLDVTTAIARE